MRAGRDSRKEKAAAKEQRLESIRVPRYKSVPPASERYVTAKRFSIARARSAGRAAMSAGSQPSGSSSMPSAGAALDLTELG